MKIRYYIVSLVLFSIFAISGAIVYFNCLIMMPKDPTDLELACFAFGFSFWPMIIGYFGIITIVAEAVRSKLFQRSDPAAPNIGSEDQQLTGPAE